MIVTNIAVLIIAPPSRLRDSLRVLLHSDQRIDHVYLADDVSTGWKIINDSRSKIIFLDASISKDSAMLLLLRLQKHCSTIPCCVIVHTLEQEEQFKMTNANFLLLAGFSAETFFNVIEAMVSIT